MFKIETTRKKPQPRKHYGFRLLVQNHKREKDGQLRFQPVGDFFPNHAAAIEYGLKHFPKNKIKAEGVRADISYTYVPLNTKV